MTWSVFIVLLYLSLICLLIAVIAKKTEAAKKKREEALARVAQSAPPSPPSVPAPYASTIQNSSEMRRFESMEGKAWIEEPEDPKQQAMLMESAGEGEDPCHSDLFSQTPESKKPESFTQQQNNEWMRAIVMSEIMKRPIERRASQRRYGGQR
ncbi:MAG: hypothetical protein IJ174_09045 [Clostridia bacterium]|nr:hypothetical protein [Clostridia bacterium]